MEGYYHSIETFGTVDGPGIRYVLFLSGCPLGCRFCHNPDTWRQGTKRISVDEVIADVQRYRAFYGGQGAITVSGGEPLLQSAFVAKLFRSCRSANIHTLLDTSGYGETAQFAEVLSVTDYLQLSLKGATARRYAELTNQDIGLVAANLRYALSATIPVVVRYVVIPGVTDTQEDAAALASLLTAMPRLPAIELLAYHQLGRQKWEKLGWDYSLTAPAATSEDVRRFGAALEKLDLKLLT
ncbi:MAG: pyruvate formate-lyase-activating protein [Sporomusaceae bacterium]|nr:pyruvate formate-lyase-activating protein [Sporomusaceae bacterium]